ncbi:MAG: ATPase domain-containing protein [Candidatus Bathyarchaeia archaeon]|nr:AAA family ATPase [Candidatus Bathyarchaeota archaeon]
MKSWIPTGCPLLDRALEGGLQPGGITLIYGEAETGKTSLAIQCSVNSARMDYKTLFIDSDGTFSPQRLMQIAIRDFNEVSQMIILLSPSTFEEQSLLMDELEKYIGKSFGLIVFDTVTTLYRSAIVSKEDAFKANRELNRQIAALAHIAKINQIPILLTSQVRNILNDVDVLVEPVAARVLRYWSTAIVGFFRTGRHNVTRAVVEKSYGVEKKITLYLRIGESGVCDYNRIKMT